MRRQPKDPLPSDDGDEYGYARTRRLGVVTGVAPDESGRSRPRVAVLSPTWESRSEEGWITRQVAGSLACIAEVHIITPQGSSEGESTDSIFTIHRLGTPIDRIAEARRDLMIEGMWATSVMGRVDVPLALAGQLEQGLTESWQGAVAVLDEIRPDLVLIAGHRSMGALAALDRHDSLVPLTLLAMGVREDSIASSHFEPIFTRASQILAVTESERNLIVAHHGRPDTVHRIGAPLAANPSALSEPNTWVGDTDYILVLTGVDSDNLGELESELSRIIRYRFPDRPVGISYNDAFCAWHEGRVNSGWPIERSSDMARLLAFARVTVDLRPGGLFARRCVDSLLYGTPIVVPHDSRAREHAQRGRGGLWFESPAELTWCIESLLESPTHDSFSAQGRAYAEEEYGSTDAFIDRVTRACGLSSADASTSDMAGRSGIVGVSA